MTSLVPSSGTLTVVKKIVIAVTVAMFAFKTFAQAPQNKLTQKVQNPESNWSFLGTLVQSKPVREELAQMTLAQLAVHYGLENSPSHKSYLGLSLEYSHNGAQYKDEIRSQIDTLTASLGRSAKINPSGSAFEYGLELDIPANQADANAGFEGSLSIPLEISLKFSSQKIFFALQPTFYQYKFKTSTEEGLEYNKKISGLATLGLNSRFTKRFAWVNSVSLFEYENMAGNTYQIYSMASFLRYQLLAAVTILGGVASRDRVISTNSVLADDITSVRAGMEWSY